MSLESQVNKVIATETAIETAPTSISIEYGDDSVWKAGADADILITCNWHGEDVPERFISEPDEDAIFHEPTVTTEKRFIAINESDAMYNSLDAVLQLIKQSLSLKSPAYIRRCTCSFNSSVSPDSEYAGEWVEELTGDIGGFVGVTVERSHTDDSAELFDCAGTVLSEQFETDSVTSVHEVELLFSDFKYNECGYCEVTFSTTDPSSFYDVETVEEYIEHISDTEEEKEQLNLQETYELTIRLDLAYDDDGEVSMGVEYLDDALQTAAEDLLADTVDEFVTTTVPAPIEGESIVLTSDSQHISWWHRPQLNYDAMDFV